MPYVKLDTGILDSSLWVLKTERDMFITALLMARPKEIVATDAIKVDSIEPAGWTVPAGWYGFVEAAGPGIGNRAGICRDEALKALGNLCSPDPESRSPEYDGRRMARVPGGYIILNYDKYREKDHTNAARQQRYRDRHSGRAYKPQGSESAPAALARIEAKRERERQARAAAEQESVTALRNGSVTLQGRYITQANANANAEANGSTTTVDSSRVRARESTTAKVSRMVFRKRGDEWVSDCGDYVVYVSRRIRQGDETEKNFGAQFRGQLFKDPDGGAFRSDVYSTRGEAQRACRKHKRQLLTAALEQDPSTPGQTSPETRRSAADPSSDPSEPSSPSDGSQGCCRRCGRAQDRYPGTDGKLCSACHQLGKRLAKHEGLSPGINDECAQAILEALLHHTTLDGIGDRVGVANWHAARLGPNSPNKLTVERVVECIEIVAQDAEDHKLETGELKPGKKCIKHLRHLTAMHEHEYAAAKAKAKEREEQAKPRKKERYVPPSGPDPKTRRPTLAEMSKMFPVSSGKSKPVSRQEAQSNASQVLKNLGAAMSIVKHVARSDPKRAWCDRCKVDTHSTEACEQFRAELEREKLP